MPVRPRTLLALTGIAGLVAGSVVWAGAAPGVAATTGDSGWTAVGARSPHRLAYTEFNGTYVASGTDAWVVGDAGRHGEFAPGYGTAGTTVGLGRVLTTADKGQIFGFDVDQHGNDGLLSTGLAGPKSNHGSVETFNETTGKITREFAVHPGPRVSFTVQGIFAGDIGLVTRYVVPHGTIYANRHYELMDPVTAQRFTGTWQMPVKDFDVQEIAVNQSTATSVVFGIELRQDDDPGLVVSDFPAGTDHFIALNPDEFSLGDTPELAQDTATNQAVIAYSPDGGAVGGSAPVNAVVNLKTGRTTQWTGLNGGAYGSGDVNGAALDPTTGIFATTTELNAQVEFYNLATHQGIAVQLPGTGGTDEELSGTSVVCDPVNGLFLVAEPVSPSQGSSVVVFDESGNVVEDITGFEFPFSGQTIAINPATRTGWALGPTQDQLQQFHY